MPLSKTDLKKAVKSGVGKHKKQVDEQIDTLEKNIEEEIKSEASKRDLLYLLAATKQKGLFFHSKFKEHSGTAIIAAFSFLIALSWKDLIVKVVDNYIKPSALASYPYLNDLVTALVVTAFSVVAIVFVAKWAGKEEKK